MAALPFTSLMGYNFRATQASLCVDCAYVSDITKTTIIFEYLCPADMKVVGINNGFANNEHPCSWEVLYAYRSNAQKVCTHEDAKNAFQEILKVVPVNVSVKDCNKQLIGVPLKYRVQYSVDSCACGVHHETNTSDTDSDSNSNKGFDSGSSNTVESLVLLLVSAMAWLLT